MAVAEHTDHRQRVYELLRDASPVVVTTTEMWRAGLTNVHAHINSLIFEGHHIEQAQVERGVRKVWGWRLVHDAWAGQQHGLPVELGELMPGARL